MVRKAVGFLTQDQSKDGSWFGRWGVNYVYGTSGVLRALETVSMTAQDYCVRAVNWLREVQKADGRFGESLNSYEVRVQQRAGCQHAFANGLGIDWTAGRR